MKKLFTFLTLLTLAITTAWAGEKTVTISRNEGQYDDQNKAYFAVKDGITLTMTGGMNNVNYLLANQGTVINILSYNYVIKKIVFHCVDNNTDPYAGYMGPSGLFLKSNFTYPTNPGTYSYSGYTGTWVGQSSSLQFETVNAVGGVRFGSIDITYEKPEGDVYDLVTSNSQIVEGKSYVIVSQYKDKAMRFKENSDESFPATNVLEWPLGENNKTKVKVDGNTQVIRMTAVKDSTIGTNTRKVAWFNVAQGYIRAQNGNLTTARNSSDYARAIMYISSLENNYLCWFKSVGSASNTIRYDYDNSLFKILNTSNANQRVWLYKQAESYKVFTKCDPTDGGTITLGDGVVDNTSQHYETVNFTVNANAGYRLSSVVVNKVNESNNTLGEEVALQDDGNGNYSFTMPDSHVRITANFEVSLPHSINTVCDPSGGGEFRNFQCNSSSTNISLGARYYRGDVIDFYVHTNMGYRINDVKLSYVEGGQTVEQTLARMSSDNEGNYYSFTMPDVDVTVTAYFGEWVPDLYLLGSHNGQDWHSYGPKFEYDSDNSEWYIDVYYKGTGSYSPSGNTDNAYGYFSVTRKVEGNATDGDNWGAINGLWNDYDGCRYRYGATWNNNDAATLITENSSPITLAQGGDNGPSAFKIPAGVYRIYVTNVNNKPGTVRVTRTDVALAFDPAGGSTETNAEMVSWGTDVTMVSDIQTKVKTIANAYANDYPQYIPSGFNEDNMSLSYSIAETTDLSISKQNGTPLYTAPNFRLVDYDIDDEGYVTVKVDGDAWIGWIHAATSGYYQVIKTPLHWIEHPDKGVEGHKYIVSDRLMGVYAKGNILWAKDVDFNSNNANAIPNGAIDYMRIFAGWLAEDAPQGYQSDLTESTAWEQKNWVQLDFSNITDGDLLAQQLQNKYMEAGSVRGTYVDDENYRIVLSQAPTQVSTQGGLLSYQPNYYNPANFMTFQGVSDATGYVATQDVATFTSAVNDRTYYFLNPKIQEYALVAFAVWDKTNHRFVMPQRDDALGMNGGDLSGAFDVCWDYNNWNRTQYAADQTSKLDAAQITGGSNAEAYIFHAIIQKPVASGSQSAPARIEPKSGTPTGNYIVYPLDLAVETEIVVTGVEQLTAGKAVQSVTYCDLAGRMSTRPLQGVNIVVTRYTDGTVRTSKAIY